ncbi:hypothetical protein D9756_002889 [Leucocoprinus leucothites]|uniref:Uncharacterized protein n=1 Tax=Leucocoprinus leucothites TaxID=201217 RepID=A0A8H5G7B5_9AGAR|nr:hypothetical protein D9756_002889 [Leucoagaricus leucothites]
MPFHRQTAPIGPGHNPRPTVPQNVIPGPGSASLSSSRIPNYGAPDEFFLAPAPSSANGPSMAESLYASSGFAFPPLYPEPATTAPGADFTSKYRAQAEMLRNTSSSAHFAPTGGGGGPIGPGMPPGGGGSSLSPQNLYSSSSEQRPGSAASSWGAVSWGHDSPDPYHAPNHPTQGTVHDKDMDQHRSHQQASPYVNSHGIPHGLQHVPGYHQQGGYLRRGSVDFAGSDGSEHSSVPSSAASSNVHLPLDGLATTHLSYNTLENLSDHRGQTSTINHQQQHSGFTGDETTAQRPNSAVSSAFGLLSLDDPNLFPGLATNDDSAPSFFPPQEGMSLSASDMNMPLTGLTSDDPDATPMPLKENSSTAGAATSSLGPPTRSASVSGASRDGDLRELREFWKQYMRTPLSGPGPADGSGPSASQQNPMSPPRRPRVASMPSSGRTPTIAVSLQHQGSQNPQQQQGGGRGESGMRTTLNDDLRSYEAAVLARKAPTNLNLVPKTRRGTIPTLQPAHHQNGRRQHQHSSASPVDNTGYHHLLPPPGGNPVVSGKGIGVVPLVNFDLLGAGSRPSSSSTNRSGSSGEGSVSSSLAGAFGAGAHHPSSYHHGASPRHHNNVPSSFIVHRRGSPSASSTSTTGRSSSRASSVSTDHDGDIEIGQDSTDESDYQHYGADGGDAHDARRRKRNVDTGGRMRPSFKRLASATLGPPQSKKRQHGDDDGSTREVEGGIESLGMGPAVGGGVEPFATGALGMH